MSEAIAVALIMSGFTLAGTVATNHFTHSKTMYRIEQLEKKQDKHNNLIERMYACENAVNILDEKQKIDEADIKELKGKIEHAG